MSEHIQTVLPEGWPRPKGYANGMVARGRTVYVAGQVAWNPQEQMVADDVPGQFDQALANVIAVVRAAGGEPRDIVRLTIYVTDLDGYRDNAAAIGAAYRERMGKHFPAMALVGVAGLVETGAKVEIEGTAVLEDK
jgi:enamine deaminase RidA (YjgF/YER057c/UK114 family)